MYKGVWQKSSLYLVFQAAYTDIVDILGERKNIFLIWAGETIIFLLLFPINEEYHQLSQARNQSILWLQSLLYYTNPINQFLCFYSVCISDILTLRLHSYKVDFKTKIPVQIIKKAVLFREIRTAIRKAGQAKGKKTKVRLQSNISFSVNPQGSSGLSWRQGSGLSFILPN